MTRQDLAPGYQAVQSIHAMRQFTHEHSEADNSWFHNSNYLALLSVPDESNLISLYNKLREKGIRVSIFTEPDIDDQATAIAIEPHPLVKKFTSNLPRALKEYGNTNLISKPITHENNLDL